MAGLKMGYVRRLAMLSGLAAGALLGTAASASSPCRITDYTDRTFSSLNGVQQLSFLSEMTPTEFAKLKALMPDDPNYSEIVAKSATAADARNAARDTLIALKVDHIDGYRRIWATDYLSDEQMRKYADCVSGRYPGLTVMGRSVDPRHFNLTYVHVTPIGIEQIETRVLASGNVANIKPFEQSLAELGPQDNYPARTFTIVREDPSKPAILLMRAGWETPRIVYIPVYPTPNYLEMVSDPAEPTARSH